MQKTLCKFCGTREHHQSEMHLCKAMAPDKSTRKHEVREAVPPPSPPQVDNEVSSGVVADSGPDRAEDVPPPSKSDRLAVATKALTDADRSQRYRDKDRETYNAKAKVRMKARRDRIRGSPSE